ncbi:HAD family phosphatase [Uliginosibacterium paludis]|uniref:HAD family phosphatase n=1 Tax=Uliginosibacterium paludis TaxID=1615952 RepID=A0ABV2CVN4_9RHOO
MMQKLSVVLFDIGGVLVELDGVPCMARLLGRDAHSEALHALWSASPVVFAHETGKIDARTFATELVAEMALPVSPEIFLQEFCRWPVGLLPGALALLDEIPDRFCVAALSNTSAAHWARIQAMGLPERFDQTWLSHLIGEMKPAPGAFLAALEGMGFPAQEVLFLDDSLRNVEAAAALGMRAHQVTSPAEARQVLLRYDVLTELV